MAAVLAESLGNRVLVLEKGPITGGTTREPGGVFWIRTTIGCAHRESRTASSSAGVRRAGSCMADATIDQRRRPWIVP
jgi:hypothetical protein